MLNKKKDLFILLSSIILVGCNHSSAGKLSYFDNDKKNFYNKALILKGTIPENTSLTLYAHYHSKVCTRSQIITPSANLFNPEISTKDKSAWDSKIFVADNISHVFNTRVPLLTNDNCKWRLASVDALYIYTQENQSGKKDLKYEYTFTIYHDTSNAETHYIFKPELYYLHTIYDEDSVITAKNELQFMPSNWRGRLNVTLADNITLTLQPAKIIDYHIDKNVYSRFNEVNKTQDYRCTIRYPDGTIYFHSKNTHLPHPQNAIINRKYGCEIAPPYSPESQVVTLMKQHDADSKLKIAAMYEKGYFLPKDNDKAKAIYVELIEKGNKEAEKRLASLQFHENYHAQFDRNNTQK